MFFVHPEQNLSGKQDSGVLPTPRTGGGTTNGVMSSLPRLYAVGDVHGDVARLEALLREAGLIDHAGDWSGGESVLVLTGDLTDRGDRGIDVIRLVMRLQEEGDVESLMGNHDALILARAFELRGERADADCRDLFIVNGGKEREARALAGDDALFAWMQARPLMRKVGDTLFQHADSAVFYDALGASVDEANAEGLRLAQSARGAWRIFYDMTDGRDWDRVRHSGLNAIVDGFDAHLARFGALRVVHGHTRHTQPEPYVYMRGRAFNIDGTLSEGYRRTPKRGFVADLGPL